MLKLDGTEVVLTLGARIQSSKQHARPLKGEPWLNYDVDGPGFSLVTGSAGRWSRDRGDVYFLTIFLRRATV